MRHRRTVVTAALVSALLPAIGCSSTSGPSHAGNISELRGNPSPAMDSLSMRGDDLSNRYAIMRDTNFRQVHDDWHAFWMTDRPSRLTFYPNP